MLSQSQARYWSNLACDWPSTAWAYSEQDTENGPCIHLSPATVPIRIYMSPTVSICIYPVYPLSPWSPWEQMPLSGNCNRNWTYQETHILTLGNPIDDGALPCKVRIHQHHEKEVTSNPPKHHQWPLATACSEWHEIPLGNTDFLFENGLD